MTRDGKYRFISAMLVVVCIVLPRIAEHYTPRSQHAYYYLATMTVAGLMWLNARTEKNAGPSTNIIKLGWLFVAVSHLLHALMLLRSV